MPTKEDLKVLEVYCRRDECGDPVLDADGNVHYTKRRMNFMGVSGLRGTATFQCPVCGRRQKYRINPLTGKINKV
jgi:hypothetical protein